MNKKYIYVWIFINGIIIITLSFKVWEQNQFVNVYESSIERKIISRLNMISELDASNLVGIVDAKESAEELLIVNEMFLNHDDVKSIIHDSYVYYKLFFRNMQVDLITENRTITDEEKEQAKRYIRDMKELSEWILKEVQGEEQQRSFAELKEKIGLDYLLN